MVFVGYGIRVNFSLLENLAGPEKVVRLNELRDYTNSGTMMDLVEKICGNEALNFDICKTDMTQTSSFRKEGCGLTYYNEFRTMEIILWVVSWEITRQVVLSNHARHHRT